ncbi:MFS-type transporter, putative [Plasmodium gallinaceum]|uniref:MFS-type transporter, putative n=1 Tax=Plasmodium gallinaceum TaxID=5849 RepID=A0A1J1GR28_PLAGA|nr:MFS-type transporter, putative [Plasmodium gallinaceum]CRG94746.1 MFS-type transporter, putative [Plasmodium gallinaceum]
MQGYIGEKLDNFKLYKRRWLMLFYFSYCCMVDNLICFTFAPINNVCYELYGVSNNIFPQVYFIIYSIFSIPLSFLLSEFSLRTNVVFSSLLQFIGCFLRYLFWDNLKLVMFGQFLSSIGQIIFVNAPPEVSLIWFPINERIISTSISIISNVLGTAIIYLYAPFIVLNKEDVKELLFSICLISFIGSVMVIFFFESSPPVSPSKTAEALNLNFHKKTNNENDNYYLSFDNSDVNRNKLSIKNFGRELNRFLGDLKIEVANILSEKEIIKILIIFCYSECLISSFSADMSIVLKEKSVNKGYFAMSGSLFIFNIVLGSALLCFNANSKYFKKLIILCVSMIMIVCVLLNFTNNNIMIILIISLIGFWSGPIQPISVEMACITVYPISSNLCTSILQVVSFTVSAIFISVFSYISKYYNISILVFFLSFLMLLISVNMKTIKKKPMNALTFSIRSGLIKRNTFHTHKFVDFFNNNDNTDELLENYNDLSMLPSDSKMFDDYSNPPSLIRFYSHFSSSPRHSTTNTSKYSDIMEENVFKIDETKNNNIKDFYKIHLSKKLNIQNLRKELLFYDHKMEILNKTTKSYSNINYDDYNTICKYDNRKMNILTHNSF